jgi:hypothetical protein
MINTAEGVREFQSRVRASREPFQLTRSGSLVVSFNGVTSLILKHEFCTQGSHSSLQSARHTFASLEMTLITTVMQEEKILAVL